MTTTDWIGTIGVSVLLLAYLLLLLKALTVSNRLYFWMNIIGAGLSTLASVFLKYVPFIILEGAWMLVSIVALFQKRKNLWQRNKLTDAAAHAMAQGGRLPTQKEQPFR